MSDGSEVVYSYVADSSGVMDAIDEVSAGIQSLIEDINGLVEASSALGEFTGIFEEIAAIFGGVDAAAMEATSGIASMAEEAGVAADALSALGADSEGLMEVGASADEASAQIEGLQSMVDSLGGQLAEDTAIIDGLNETIINLQGQLDALTGSADTAAESVNNMSTSLSESNSAFSEVSASASVFIDGLGSAAGGIGDFTNSIFMGAMKFQMFSNMATQAATSLLGPAESAETMQTAFTTLLGSTKAATDEMQKLDAFASKTPFKTMDIDQAASQLIGFGTSTKDVIPDLTAIGDALSAVGKGSQANLMGVVNIFGKIQLSGKLTAADMNQFSARGINAWAVLEQQTGKTQAQLQSMIKSGLLPAKDAIKDLTEGIEKNPLYAGGMAKQSETAAGLISTLKSNWDQFLTALGTPILKAVEGDLGNIGNALASPAFKDMAGGVGQGIANVFNAIGGAVTYVGDVLRSLNLVGIKDAWSAFSGEVSYLAQTFGSLVSAASPLGNALKEIGTDADPIADAIGNLARGALNTLSNLLLNTSTALTNLYSDFLEGQGPLASIKNAFDQVSAILGGQFKADLAWLGNTFNQIGGWIKSSLMPALATLVPPFMSIANTVVTNLLPAWATLYATGHQLVESLLTPLIGVLENITPPIISIAGWLLGGLAAGFQLVAPLVKILADAISGLVDFFTKTEVGAALVKAALITLSIPVGILAIGFTVLAVEAIAAFIASIPAMVTGFLAGAAAAWSMAAGVIAATWPFLAIAAVVVAVIAVIILAIQHWGDIVNWLKSAWSSTVSFFSSLWENIKNIFSGVGQWFQDRFSEASKGVQNAWNGFQDHAKEAGNNVKNAWDDASKKTSDAFMYMYKHSYVFQAIVDNLTGSTRAGIAMLQSAWQWLVGAWTSTSNWLVGAWNATAKFASDLWKKVSDAVRDGWNAAVKWVQDVWTSISNTFSAAWSTYIAAPLAALWTNVSTFFSNTWTNYVAKPLSDMWTNVSKAFSNAWTDHVSKPLSDTGKNISDTVSGWAASAWQWGVNLITSLANGITSAVGGALHTALTGAANTVKALIGWHSPTKEGPGSESDKWAPALMNMFINGIKERQSQLKQVMDSTAAIVSDSLNTQIHSQVSMQVSAMTSAMNSAQSMTTNLPQGPSAASNANSAQIAQLLQQFLQQQQSRQQVPQPTSANLGAVTQHFSGGINFSGVPQDINALFQMLNQLSGLQFEYGQRGATFNY